MYIAEIESLTKFANRSVEEELNKLKKLGLLVSTRDRSRVYYEANQAHPLYSDIRNIVLKTSGLTDVLQHALKSDEIEFAFVFGSLAAGTEQAESDLDLMVIGSLGERTLSTLLRGVSERIRREVNPHVFTRPEILRRVSENNHFLNDVLAKPKLFIIGDEHEFARLAQRRLDSTSHVQP
jgi:predicted nucleotidyltransferase